MPDPESGTDDQQRMRDILQNLKDTKVLASPRRWRINIDFSDLK